MDSKKNKKNGTLKASFEVAKDKKKGALQLPINPINELVAVTTRCIDTIRKGPERIGKMLSNSTFAIGKPIGAWLEGKADEIKANSQLIVANIMYKKEINAVKHLQYVAEEFNYKFKQGADIPERIEESDNLLLIQDNASTTSNDEFLKLWAKLYAEEACKPGTVSRKTIKLFEGMDSNIIKVLENEVFPFCDGNGFYWGKTNDITALSLAQDYGFIDDKQIAKYSPDYKTPYYALLNNANIMYIHPGFCYSPQSHYVLTKSGLEIKNLLKIYPNRNQIKNIIHNIEHDSIYWDLVEDKNIKLIEGNLKIQKFIICDKNKKIKYPKSLEYTTLKEYTLKALENLGGTKNNAK